MDTAEYTIHEGCGIEVYAEVAYTIHDACGDGWHEPHEPAHVQLGKVKLFKRTKRVVVTRDGSGFNPTCKVVWDTADLGEAPAWVDDIIAADEDWQNDLIANDGPDPDRLYDERRDRELTER
jgi:hypothetical protein